MTPPIVAAAALACAPEAIMQAVESALALLAEPARPLPDPYQATSAHDRLVATLAHNLAAGRYARACLESGRLPLSLAAYAMRVAAGLSAEWERVAGLRSGRSALWAALLEDLERKAYCWLGPSGRAGWARIEAADAAARTCADLWCWLQEHPYPFDVPFERWVGRMLRNRLLEAVRSQRTADRYVVDSLDRSVDEHDTALADLAPWGRSDTMADDILRREALQRALARLEARQAQVVRLWYLEELPATEIARSLRLTVNCVYTLKHRALRRLRADPALAA